MSNVDAPSVRQNHVAVWTGTWMVVWGGRGSTYLATGGVYDPKTDTWSPTSTINAPTARDHHTGVWTGTELIVWGGGPGQGFPVPPPVNTGGRYDPQTDTWTATSLLDAPFARVDHSAVWMGSRMLIWGGSVSETHSTTYLGSGAQYDPVADAWTPIATPNAPWAGPTTVPCGTVRACWSGEGSATSPPSRRPRDS
jgi:N-acetylneuraminic acid mutarotase